MSVHVFYGHAKREPEPEDRCLYCDAHEPVMAYTYFGAPVCGRCWDGRWRQEEDGKTDPPFAEITRKVSGEWLTPSTPASEPVSLRPVYCRHCHKTHSVAEGEEECSPGAWLEGGEPWPTDTNQDSKSEARND